MVYVRPRYIEARKKDPDSSILQMVWRTLFPEVDVDMSMAVRRASLVVRRSSLFPTLRDPDAKEPNTHDGDSNMEAKGKEGGYA